MGLPWSIHKNGGWQGQWHRVERWQRRVLQAASLDPSSDDTLDYLWTFFQNYHHLRDWLFTAKIMSHQSIDALYSGHVELRVVRDICNATKHLSIQRADDPDVSILREYWWDGWRLEVLHGSERYDLLDLIEKSMHLMREFLQPILLSSAELEKAANWKPRPDWLLAPKSKIKGEDARRHDIAEGVSHALLHAQPALAHVVVHTEPCGHGGVDPHLLTAHHLPRTAAKSS